MFGRHRKTSRASTIGCGFILMTGFVICALLFINAVIVKAFLSANLEQTDKRILQAAQFVAPVLMILFEFWFFDLVNRRRNIGEPDDPAS